MLGQKTGAEPRPRQVREAPNATGSSDTDEAGTHEEPRPQVRPAFTGPAAAGLEAIASNDPEFDPNTFTRGARGAYELIVAAYADGDRDALRPLVDDDVYELYDKAIVERVAAETEPMRLLRIKSARIVEASLDDDRYSRVGVAFESELSDGENMRKAREIWTFKRPIDAADPNWLLDEVNIDT